MRAASQNDPLVLPSRCQMKGLRVVHLCQILFGVGGLYGGGERYALELARHMAEVTPTTLVSFGEHSREETLGRLRVRVLGRSWYIRGQRGNPVSWSLAGVLRRTDVVHCHQQHILASSLAAGLCWLTRKRVFVSDLG